MAQQSFATSDVQTEDIEMPSCGAFGKLLSEHMRSQVGGVRLDWRDVHFAVGGKEILKGVSGKIEPGRLVGIMGPSGSGKTTLMNVLSGRQRRKGVSGGATTRVGFSGEICIDGQPATEAHIRSSVAYVFQDVALVETETPRDCLNFSAMLRLPMSFTRTQREAYIDGMLGCLGLSDCADTCVGSAMLKGLSGGEQKRVAIGVELISNPSVVFLDEPLSGLDASNAYVCTRSLKSLATSGVAVLVTLHQASSEIFAELDDVVVLEGGEVCFHGPRASLTAHFQSLGLCCPANFNPADYIMFAITSSPADRIASIKQAWAGSAADAESYTTSGGGPSDSDWSTSPSEVGDGGKSQSACTRRSSSGPQRFWGALRALLRRDGRGLCRQRGYILVVHVVQLGVAALYGWFFFQNGVKEDSPEHTPNCSSGSWSTANCSAMFNAHIALASLICLNMMLVSLNLAIDTLHKERGVLLREIAGGYYSVLPFFAAKCTSELVLSSTISLASLVGVYFLSGLRGNFFLLFASMESMTYSSSSLMHCLSAGMPTREAAAGVAILPQVLQFAFSGMLMPTRLIPHSLRWLRFLCPLYYGIGLVMGTEFSYVFKDAEQCEARYGQSWTTVCKGAALKLETLRLYEVSERGMHRDAVCLVGLLVVYRVAAVLILWRKTRFVI